jgi:predicted nucleotidyltransferase
VSLAATVRAALEPHPAVQSVSLAGSRARGEETALSDWDFEVVTSEFEALAEALPRLVDPLDPISRQWDRYSRHPTYMLMLRGPVKVDLLFLGRANRPRPPWTLSRETLAAIDDHFWDWILWLASKDRAGGRDELVRQQMSLLHEQLLAPIGVANVPGGVEEAVRMYVAARARAEQRLGAHVDQALGHEVAAGLRRAGYALTAGR